MIINKITIKNLKSFGNDVQEIDLTNDGNLILLSGKNGAGKSSIIDSFDYVLFNKVKGRKSKKVKLSSLPNRLNGNLEVTIEFTALDGTEVKIIRGYAPNRLKLFENKVENLRAGKAKIDALIEGYIGIDYDTFKGFISMSINDFKNFISLTNEEKKLLLDKLFNLEVINILNKILNDLIRENKKELDLLDREISIITENIDNINYSIDKVKKSKQDDLTDQIALVKENIEKNRTPFNEVKEKLTLVKTKQKEIADKISTEKTQLIEINSEIRMIDKQLELFKNDKCPTCQGDLNSGFHKGLKEGYVEKKTKFEELVLEIKKRGSSLKEKETKLSTIYDKGNNKYMELNSTLKSLKREYDGLILKEKENVIDTDLEEFYSSIDKSKIKLDTAETNKAISDDKTIYHKHIKSVLSENGVRKSIIKNIIEPINFFVSENVQKMHLPFEVTLDDTFTADITSFGEPIDIDTLSTGETKKINVCILIAYLRLIRTKKQMNILFLDEVFSSVDVESINDVIGLLRDLVTTSKINIFLVHHSLLDSQHFDKIYQIKKDIFSYIEEIEDI
jgi:exonuclease SbcC